MLEYQSCRLGARLQNGVRYYFLSKAANTSSSRAFSDLLLAHFDILGKYTYPPTFHNKRLNKSEPFSEVYTLAKSQTRSE
jgi:hypothetical protein